MHPALELTRVSVPLGPTRAIDDLTIEVPAGTRAALVGPSGCGHTALFRALCGDRPISAGAIRYLGVATHGRHPDVVRRAGFLSSDLPEEDALEVVIERVIRGGVLGGLTGFDARRQAEQQLSITGLADHPARLMGSLEEAARRRVRVLATMLARPALVILDEPARGLSPSDRTAVLQTIADALPATSALLLLTSSADDARALGAVIRPLPVRATVTSRRAA